MRVLTHPVFWLLALLPLGWVTLARPAGFSFAASYVPMLAILPAVLISPPQAAGLARVLRGNGAVIGLFVAYLLVVAIALWSGEARGLVIRQTVFLVFCIGAAGAVAGMSSPAAVLRAGGIAAIVLFVVTVEVLARRVGQSWLTAVPRFLASGDLDFIVYGFFRAALNALGDSETIVASAKNAIAVAVLTGGIACRAGWNGAGRDWWGKAVFAGTMFLLLLLNTRSVLLVGLASYPLAGWIATARAGGQSLPLFLAKSFAALAMIAALVAVSTSDNALFALLGDRFAFDDASAGARSDQFRWAFGRIEGAILTGSGYAEIGGHPVHNLFLGAWMHAGLPAFALVTGAYLMVVAALGRFITSAILRPAHWVLPLRPEWVAMLPLVCLFRVWLSGDAGHPAFAEWVGLAIFAGLLAANDLRRAGART